METVNVKVQELKKGDKVLFYCQVFIVISDAKNYGNNRHEITNTIDDVWVAECRIIEKTGDRLLDNYNRFQGNGRATQALIID